MGDRHVIPAPSIAEIRESDVLELDIDLYVAVEDGRYVGDSRPFDAEGKRTPSNYAVRDRSSGRATSRSDWFRGLTTGTCPSGIEGTWDTENGDREAFDRCFCSGLAVSKTTK